MNANRGRWLGAVAGIAGIAVAGAFAVANAQDGDGDLDQIRSAAGRFERVEVAQAAGWDLREGLDRCFENPGVGAMGYHYINLDLLQDLTEDVDRPEALVYAPGPNGQRTLGAVEYIVPVPAWDGAGHTAPPELLGRRFHLNEELGVYILHAWAFKENPAGDFEDWNPTVSCPPGAPITHPAAGTAGHHQHAGS